VGLWSLLSLPHLPTTTYYLMTPLQCRLLYSLSAVSVFNFDTVVYHRRGYADLVTYFKEPVHFTSCGRISVEASIDSPSADLDQVCRILEGSRNARVYPFYA
jgi:hypothetical protein